MYDKNALRMLMVVEGWSKPLLEYSCSRILQPRKDDKLILAQVRAGVLKKCGKCGEEAKMCLCGRLKRLRTLVNLLHKGARSWQASNKAVSNTCYVGCWQTMSRVEAQLCANCAFLVMEIHSVCTLLSAWAAGRLSQRPCPHSHAPAPPHRCTPPVSPQLSR